jgi:hypothetical protein
MAPLDSIGDHLGRQATEELFSTEMVQNNESPRFG